MWQVSHFYLWNESEPQHWYCIFPLRWLVFVLQQNTQVHMIRHTRNDSGNYIISTLQGDCIKLFCWRKKKITFEKVCFRVNTGQLLLTTLSITISSQMWQERKAPSDWSTGLNQCTYVVNIYHRQLKKTVTYQLGLFSEWQYGGAAVA